MQRHSLHRAAVTLLLISMCGCNVLPWRKKEVVTRDPVLPMTLNRHELVDYINSQIAGLESWRCTDTKMSVRMPGLPLPQQLTGSIACQSPQRFHLKASNFIAQADLGSNDERCWVYTKPGESAVLTWRHEDTPLLQQIPTGVPYIDPNWLMLVVGVKPLDAEEYLVSEGPVPQSRQLWLSATERSPEGRTLQRIVKVDTVNGVVREHAVVDDQENVVVRATLSNHKAFQGHLIATKVRLDFPQMDSEITLQFGHIDTNPHLPDPLWKVPRERNMDVVDLGDVLRAKLRHDGFVVPEREPAFDVDPLSVAPSDRLQQPQFEPGGEQRFADSHAANSWPGHNLDEPNWDISSPFDEGPEDGPADETVNQFAQPSETGRTRFQ